MTLVTQSVELPSGELRLLQPEESAELPDDGAVEWAPLAPYWSVLWRSGVALARELEGAPLDGLRVVELGCGIAVPSIAAARAGADVLATDSDPEALELVAQNAQANGVQVETAVVDWAQPDDACQPRAVRPRARGRRPVRAGGRRPAAIAPTAACARGLAGRSRPHGGRCVSRGGAPPLGSRDAGSRRRPDPPASAGLIQQQRAARGGHPVFEAVQRPAVALAKDQCEADVGRGGEGFARVLGIQRAERAKPPSRPTIRPAPST